MNAAKRNELSLLHRDELIENIVPFWLKSAIDRENGGFFSCLDRRGDVFETDKSVWAQGRSAWMLLELYNDPILAERPERAGWFQAAESIIGFLEQFCFDDADGRMWFQVTADGRPIRKRRYSYSESFAAIAFGEMAKATQNANFRTKAITCFEAFIQSTQMPTDYPSKFTDTRPAKAIGLPMIALVTAQELRDSIDLPNANTTIDGLIREIESDFWKPELDVVMETVAADGSVLNHIDGWTLNPGHAIEAAWFVMQEGDYRSDARLISLGCDMLKAMFERGWDQEFGGLFYFVGLDEKKPVQEYWHDMKFWWNHNELMIASLLAYRLTGNQSFSDMYQMTHEWAFDHFADKEFGEWFGYLHRDGSVSNYCKGNLWKSLFHIPRMHLNCWRIFKSFA